MKKAPKVPPESVESFDRFVDSCMLATNCFSLVPGGAPSPFALCFGIFALHLTRRHETLAQRRGELFQALLDNLTLARKACSNIYGDKSYRQLLTFSLSALSILDRIRAGELADLVLEQISKDTAEALNVYGALEGLPQSGNQAMFDAIFLLHAKRYLGYPVQPSLSKWVDLHLTSMNRFGFWGKGEGPTHLHFQNGYHQYEILDYIGVRNAKESEAVHAVVSLADRRGHFAPYPGGGACFDYDAVFLLTPNGKLPQQEDVAAKLSRTFSALIDEQRQDGGFCENLVVRPRYKALLGYVESLLSAKNSAVLEERVRYTITLQRRRHNQLLNHWSKNPRRWSDSDLFSSWFRFLTLARIECAFTPERALFWGFINYPGIGWHSSLRVY